MPIDPALAVNTACNKSCLRIEELCVCVGVRVLVHACLFAFVWMRARPRVCSCVRSCVLLVCVYVYVPRVCTCLCLCVREIMSACARAHVCASTHINAYVCFYARMCVCVNAYLRVSEIVCACARAHLYARRVRMCAFVFV